MTQIHFGVVDVAYPQLRSKKGRFRKGKITSTGTIADILEAKYGIMEAFAEIRHVDISKAIAPAMEKYFQSVANGEKPNLRLFEQASNRVRVVFKQFLLEKEMDGLVDGVPTKASLTGKGRRSGRPGASFVDSGLYSDHMRIWAE